MALRRSGEPVEFPSVTSRHECMNERRPLTPLSLLLPPPDSLSLTPSPVSPSTFQVVVADTHLSCFFFIYSTSGQVRVVTRQAAIGNTEHAGCC